MTEFHSYRAGDAAALAAIWNTCFSGEPNFIQIGEPDLRSRVLDQPAFDPSGLTVARRGQEVVGFVHFGPRLNAWEDWGRGARDKEEGQVYALVAPESERSLIANLLAAAEARLVAGGARRILLGPSWVYGVQPFYNGIAGAYEIPGLSVTRDSAITIAHASGYQQLAEYGTPELDLSGPDPLRHISDAADALREKAREWGLRLHHRPIELRSFPSRISVELMRGREVIATAAHGKWPEYMRQYGRQVHGFTSVQVAPDWHGRGLGKLIMIEALQAARSDGAQTAHLHVWSGNGPAWNLYHRALGFQPTYTWITLEKKLGC